MKDFDDLINEITPTLMKVTRGRMGHSIIDNYSGKLYASQDEDMVYLGLAGMPGGTNVTPESAIQFAHELLVIAHDALHHEPDEEELWRYFIKRTANCE